MREFVDVVKSVLLLALLALCAYLLGTQRAFGSEPPPVRQPPPVKAPAPPQAPPVKACVCGDSCKCKAGECPAKCPVAAEKPKPKRVRMAGYWWDDLGDGTFRWCTACNGPYPAAGVPGMVLVRP